MNVADIIDRAINAAIEAVRKMPAVAHRQGVVQSYTEGGIATVHFDGDPSDVTHDVRNATGRLAGNDRVDILTTPGGGAVIFGRRTDDIWHRVGAPLEPDFEGAWTGGAWFRRDIAGNVQVHLGSVSGGAAGTTIFTLPYGYHPSGDRWWVLRSNGGHVDIDINNDGQVIYVGGGSNVLVRGEMFFDPSEAPF